MAVPAPKEAKKGGDFEEGQQAVVVVRPEMVEIDPAEAQVEGKVRRATYLGNIIEYDVEVAGQLLALVENDPRRATVHPEGTTVGLRLLEDCLYVLPRREAEPPVPQNLPNAN